MNIFESRSLSGILFSLAFMGFAPIAFGQSRADYARMVEAERAHSEMKMAYQAATKLRLPVDKEVSNDLPEQHHSLQLNDLKAGDVGKLEYWSFTVREILSDKQTAIASGSGTVYILVDYPNADLVSGEELRLIGLVRIGEPLSLPGGKFRSIKFLDGKEQAERAEAEARAQREKASDEFELKSGETFTARFVEFKNGLFVFEAIDGTRIEKKTAELSTKAVNAIRAKLKAANSAPKKKK